MAVETKSWVDEKGKRKTKTGFAKIMVAKETKKEAQKFVDEAIAKDSMVNTDASPSLIHLKSGCRLSSCWLKSRDSGSLVAVGSQVHF